MALDRLLDLLAHRLLCFSCIFLCFSYSCVRHTTLASSLVNFWAHNNIVFDLIRFDWRCRRDAACSTVGQRRPGNLDHRWSKDRCVVQQAMMSMQSGEPETLTSFVSSSGAAPAFLSGEAEEGKTFLGGGSLYGCQ